MVDDVCCGLRVVRSTCLLNSEGGTGICHGRRFTRVGMGPGAPGCGESGGFAFTKRSLLITREMAEQPQAPIPEHNGARGQSLATYRFQNNGRNHAAGACGTDDRLEVCGATHRLPGRSSMTRCGSWQCVDTATTAPAYACSCNMNRTREVVSRNQTTGRGFTIADRRHCNRLGSRSIARTSFQ